MRTFQVFELADAPHEIRVSEEARYLVDTSGDDIPALQVWIGREALTLEPPVAGQEIIEVTLWEHRLYRWLTELGAAPGETAYVVWKQDPIVPSRSTSTNPLTRVWTQKPGSDRFGRDLIEDVESKPVTICHDEEMVFDI